MPIILPYNLTNGPTADALQVMANFNALLAGPYDDGMLASPNNQIRKLVHQAEAGFGVNAAGTWAAWANGDTHTSGTAVSSAPAAFHFDPARYTVAGKTTQLLVRASLITNNTAPGGNFNFGYSAVTASAGGTGMVSIAFGAAVGSTAQFVNPAAPALLQAESATFAAPAAGFYVPTVLTSANTQNFSWEALTWQLYVVNT